MDTTHAVAHDRSPRGVDRNRRSADRTLAHAVARPATLSTAALVDGIRAAAAQTCAGIAASGKRSADEVSRRLDPAIRWLIAHVERPGDDTKPTPIVPREYVDRLRSNLIRSLSTCEVVKGRDAVLLMELLERLSEAWQQTDRGKFMTYLTGSDSASAVVAIAHDIRSPLSSILILVESLRRNRAVGKNSIQDRQLGLIYGATHGLATLASDLIDAARGDNLVDGTPSPFSVSEVMQSVRAIVEPIAEEKALRLEMIPPEHDGRIGHGTALHRVLLNLTSNALRYTTTGSVTVGCRERSATCVEFWVQDSGRGLPSAVLKTLFDAFRPEDVALRFSSSGLGLSTVRALLAGMHSVLRVESKQNEGTRLAFELDLPPSPR